MAKTTFVEYLQNTEDAISSGHINDAMAKCQHILSYFPDALDAQRLLGEIYLAQGQLEEAQQTFDWILVNDPENVDVYCDRALTSEHLSDIDTALDCYQQAYELSRGNSQIRQQFNQLSSKVGKKEPIVLSDLTADVQVSKYQTAINPTFAPNGSQSFAEPEDLVHNPGNLETWSELNTMQSSLNDIKPVEELSAFASRTEISNVP